MAKTPLFRALKRAILMADQQQLLNEKKFSRRNLLKAGAALTALAGPLSYIPKAEAFLGKTAKHLSMEPVVILGGGLAGLTAAYRLLQVGIPVEIYEAANRLGGRVYTLDNFANGKFCELGGELIDSIHEDIIRLSHELGVAIDDFRPGDADVEGHLFYFNGQYYYDKDAVEAAVPLAVDLRKEMAKLYKNPNDNITYKTFTPYAAELDRVSLTDYLDKKKEHVAPWLLKALEVAYLAEYGLDTHVQSCLNLLTILEPDQFSVFGSSDECMRIHGGNSRLVEALIKPITKKRGIIRTEHKLVAIKNKGQLLEFSFKRGASTKTVLAKQAICTLPFSTLREVEGLEKLGLSPVKLKCIQNLSYGTNTKHMFNFKEQIWRQGIQKNKPVSGYVFTDLLSQCFWDSGRLQPGKNGIMTNFLGGKLGFISKAENETMALADLEKIYPGVGKLYTGDNARFVWGSYPLAKGSYICPTIGQYTTIFGSAQEEELGGRLLFAGEHTSTEFQGFMNGSVASGNVAARSIIQRQFKKPTANRGPTFERSAELFV
jgi:monoamine oxidase